MAYSAANCGRDSRNAGEEDQDEHTPPDEAPGQLAPQGFG